MFGKAFTLNISVFSFQTFYFATSMFVIIVFLFFFSKLFINIIKLLQIVKTGIFRPKKTERYIKSETEVFLEGSFEVYVKTLSVIQVIAAQNGL